MQAIIDAVSIYFGSIAALAAGIVVLSEGATKFVTQATGWKAWVQSWLISIAVCLFGAGFHIGIFSDPSGMAWYFEGLVAGLCFGLVANGLFSIPGVTAVLEAIKVRDKPPEPPAPPKV